MHGAILMELECFVVAGFSRDAWKQMHETAGVKSRIYVPISTYPDEDVVALVGAASELSGQSVGDLLGAFGEYLAPALLSSYGQLLDPAWRTLEVLEHVEKTIHRVVRLREPDAMPPHLECERLSDREVRVRYSSERGLCALATGLARGIASAFNERLSLEEPVCMLTGGAHCDLHFSLR